MFVGALQKIHLHTRMHVQMEIWSLAANLICQPIAVSKLKIIIIAKIIDSGPGPNIG